MDISDLDIYNDLDAFHEEEQKKSAELVELEDKYKEALETIDVMNVLIKGLNKKQETMKVNFQNLLDTAKIELKRKDKQIEQLRREKDDLCLRRNNCRKDFGNPFRADLMQTSTPDRQNDLRETQNKPDMQNISSEISTTPKSNHKRHRSPLTSEFIEDKTSRTTAHKILKKMPTDAKEGNNSRSFNKDNEMASSQSKYQNNYQRRNDTSSRGIFSRYLKEKSHDFKERKDDRSKRKKSDIKEDKNRWMKSDDGRNSKENGHSKNEIRKYENLREDELSKEYENISDEEYEDEVERNIHDHELSSRSVKDIDLKNGKVEELKKIDEGEKDSPKIFDRMTENIEENTAKEKNTKQSNVKNGKSDETVLDDVISDVLEIPTNADLFDALFGSDNSFENIDDKMTPPKYLHVTNKRVNTITTGSCKEKPLLATKGKAENTRDRRSATVNGTTIRPCLLSSARSYEEKSILVLKTIKDHAKTTKHHAEERKSPIEDHYKRRAHKASKRAEHLKGNKHLINNEINSNAADINENISEKVNMVDTIAYDHRNRGVVRESKLKSKDKECETNDLNMKIKDEHLSKPLEVKKIQETEEKNNDVSKVNADKKLSTTEESTCEKNAVAIGNNAGTVRTGADRRLQRVNTASDTDLNAMARDEDSILGSVKEDKGVTNRIQTVAAKKNDTPSRKDNDAGVAMVSNGGDEPTHHSSLINEKKTDTESPGIVITNGEKAMIFKEENPPERCKENTGIKNMVHKNEGTKEIQSEANETGTAIIVNKVESNEATVKMQINPEKNEKAKGEKENNKICKEEVLEVNCVSKKMSHEDEVPIQKDDHGNTEARPSEEAQCKEDEGVTGSDKNKSSEEFKEDSKNPSYEIDKRIKSETTLDDDDNLCAETTQPDGGNDITDEISDISPISDLDDLHTVSNKENASIGRELLKASKCSGNERAGNKDDTISIASKSILEEDCDAVDSKSDKKSNNVASVKVIETNLQKETQPSDGGRPSHIVSSPKSIQCVGDGRTAPLALTLKEDLDEDNIDESMESKTLSCATKTKVPFKVRFANLKAKRMKHPTSKKMDNNVPTSTSTSGGKVSHGKRGFDVKNIVDECRAGKEEKVDEEKFNDVSNNVIDRNGACEEKRDVDKEQRATTSTLPLRKVTFNVDDDKGAEHREGRIVKKPRRNDWNLRSPCEKADIVGREEMPHDRRERSPPMERHHRGGVRKVFSDSPPVMQSVASVENNDVSAVNVAVRVNGNVDLATDTTVLTEDGTLSDDEIRLKRIFQSPTTQTTTETLQNVTPQRARQLSSPQLENASTPTLTEEMEETLEQVLQLTPQRENRGDVLNESAGSGETKCLSLGSSEYRVEKVSDNVVNVFVKRRGRKRKNSQ